jgi:hypothetical protein
MAGLTPSCLCPSQAAFKKTPQQKHVSAFRFSLCSLAMLRTSRKLWRGVSPDFAHGFGSLGKLPVEIGVASKPR